MKKRILWKMFVLEIVTFGIYRLYYLLKTRSEMMKLNPAIKIKSPAWLFAPLAIIIIGAVLLVVGIVSQPQGSASCSSSSTSVRSGSSYDSSSTTTSNDCPAPSAAFIIGILAFYLSIFLSLIFVIIYEWSYAHGVSIITGEKLSFALALVVLILVPDGIDILVIQDYFNKLELGQVTPPASPGQPAFAPATPPAV